MSQSQNDNSTSASNDAASKAKRYKAALILGVVAVSLYVGSIAWFYVTRGAA